MTDEILEPEPFPYCAELVLAQHILKQTLKEKDESIKLDLSRYLSDRSINVHPRRP